MDTTSALHMPGLPDAHTQPILGLDTIPVFEEDDVAKKQAVKPAPKIVASQPNAITIRGSAEWKSWLEDFASRMRTKPTAVIDFALAKLRSRKGFANRRGGSNQEGSDPWPPESKSVAHSDSSHSARSGCAWCTGRNTPSRISSGYRSRRSIVLREIAFYVKPTDVPADQVQDYEVHWLDLNLISEVIEERVTTASPTGDNGA